jgi:hypothetical protein
VTPEYDFTLPEFYFGYHAGGLTFAADGCLYFVASRPRGGEYILDSKDPRAAQGVVWRHDPKTDRREEVAILQRPDACAQYVSRGAVDRHGDLFFGHVGPRPVGIFKVNMPADRKKENAHLPLRMWG